MSGVIAVFLFGSDYEECLLEETTISPADAIFLCSLDLDDQEPL